MNHDLQKAPFAKEQKLIYLAFLLEFLFFTYLRNKAGHFVSPFLFYFSSVAVCTLFVRHWLNRPFLFSPAPLSKKHYITAALVLITSFIITSKELRSIFPSWELIPSNSDVIPTIQIFVKRFLAGEWEYALIQDFGWDLHPTYLPMQWLPYVLAEKAGIDYRFFAFLILTASLALYAFILSKRTLSFHETALKTALPFGVLLVLILREEPTFGLTVETMVIGFYLLLLAGIFINNTLLIAAALVACLLSRFSLLFWVPLYILLVFFCEKKSKAVYICLLVGAGILAIYIIPFLSKDWGSFSRGMGYYTDAALGEWRHLDANGKPVYLYNGLGFASFFYHPDHALQLPRLLLLKKLHIIFSLGSVVLSGFIFYKLRNRIDYRIFALASFKFYLATFYAFIQVPYPYLIMISLFFSCFMLAFVNEREPQAKTI